MAFKVVQDATTITVMDEQAYVINPEAKKMADEIEAKMEKEKEKVGCTTVISFWICSFIILGAIGVIFESAAFIKIPHSDGSPLALNHCVLLVFAKSSGVIISLALCFLATQVKYCLNLNRKSKETKLLVNLIRKTNQGEGGVLWSAVEELNEEYRQKQKTLEVARIIIVLVTGCLVMWVGTYVAMVGMVDYFYPLKDVAGRTFWDLAPGSTVSIIFLIVLIFLFLLLLI